MGGGFDRSYAKRQRRAQACTLLQPWMNLSSTTMLAVATMRLLSAYRVCAEVWVSACQVCGITLISGARRNAVPDLQAMPRFPPRTFYDHRVVATHCISPTYLLCISWRRADTVGGGVRRGSRGKQAPALQHAETAGRTRPECWAHGQRFLLFAHA